MKTAIEISDALLQQTRRVAARKHTSLRALVERGLRQVVTDQGQTTPFALRWASFKGHGLQTPEVGWEQVCAMAYEGHGG